ncbi:MAG: putative ADP-ribose pyrophosphatase [Holophagaceae bacterium]|nr:putative ADP-ribose pyrophosphatase [Holophagaceae bacterium]
MGFTAPATAFCPACGHATEVRMVHGRPRPACPDCRFVHFPNPRVAAVAFVTRENHVLLVKRGVQPEKGKWALPAGFIDLGEHPEKAAIREVKEETGLDITIERQMGLNFDPTSKAIVILYKAQTIGGSLAASDDAADARWFDRKDLPELAFESTRKAVQEWLTETHP